MNDGDICMYFKLQFVLIEMEICTDLFCTSVVYKLLIVHFLNLQSFDTVCYMLMRASCYPNPNPRKFYFGSLK